MRDGRARGAFGPPPQGPRQAALAGKAHPQAQGCEGHGESTESGKAGHQRRRCNNTLQPMTVTAAGFVMLLTSISADEMTADKVLQTYRLRWQVELAFKRLKSGMGIHNIPARDERLARSWLMAHLILAR
ncbi:transposase [Mesorhizobium sp. M00.F.Ca.ET.216.01.1.1]|uniref:transposase n=1 Tax=Mesorhizobium sp. M00.F.Ca.ET.216.01.1.1 TaxID=2500528 RepID=UPI000FDC9CBC|nr:IS4/IS5 family transposase [Mesorhizobium sp. M00.F.Ca.ET.216.01.1.1]